MIKGIGTDIVEIDRIKAAVSRRPRFLERVFTAEERRYCLSKPNPWPSLAARFAAKEAARKALGVGLGAFSWQEIEIVKRDNEPPALQLSGKGLFYAKERSITHWHVSLSHNHTAAVALVIAEGREQEEGSCF